MHGWLNIVGCGMMGRKKQMAVKRVDSKAVTDRAPGEGGASCAVSRRLGLVGVRLEVEWWHSRLTIAGNLGSPDR